MANDGTVKIGVELDESGLESGLKKSGENMRKSVQDIAKETGKTVDQIKDEVKRLAEQFQASGDNIPTSYKKAYKEMGIDAKSMRQDVEKEAKKLPEGFEESSKKASDDVKKETEKIPDHFKKSGEESSRKFSEGLSKIGSAAKSALKGITVALGVATTAVGALTKSALDAYASYEQLTGGIETLFGAGGKTIEEYAASVGKSVDEVSGDYQMLMDRQEQVFQNAANAYKTSGMSANEYMETVTGFSASLIQSLGEYSWQAASYADQAITDMSDNANKMGTDIESIQYAYQGFAKQNYTINKMSVA